MIPELFYNLLTEVSMKLKHKVLLTIAGALLLAFFGALVPNAVADMSTGNTCPTCGKSQDPNMGCVHAGPNLECLSLQ